MQDEIRGNGRFCRILSHFLKIRHFKIRGAARRRGKERKSEMTLILYLPPDLQNYLDILSPTSKINIKRAKENFVFCKKKKDLCVFFIEEIRAIQTVIKKCLPSFSKISNQFNSM